MISIYITCENKKEAQKIGLYLVQKRLVACINIFPIESIYWWPSSAPASTEASAGKKASVDKQNKIVKDKEVILIAKTLKKNFKKIAKEVKKLHSYSVPFISEIPVKKVNREYLNWLKKEIK